MSAPTAQALPPALVLTHAYWDGTNLLNAVPVKWTAHSQTIDLVAFAQDGTESLKTNVRHQSSGDTNYWYQGIVNPTS